MTKSVKPGKFEGLNASELLRVCLEQEDELERLRPRPALFKLGQLVAFKTPNQYWKGQPVIYFSVLSTELRNGEWYYGHSKSGPQTFMVYPEKKCRGLSPTELDGTVVENSNEPQTLEVQAPALPGQLGAGFAPAQVNYPMESPVEID